MDILISSNIERILFDLFGAARTRDLLQQLDKNRHYQLSSTELKSIQTVFAADYCNNAEGMAYIKHAFDQGYLMDPHTATCFKTYTTCRPLPLKTIVYSTAEWTKFSPVIAAALTGVADIQDMEALATIAKVADIKIPPIINALFSKALTQKTVIDKADIETEILKFL